MSQVFADEDSAARQLLPQALGPAMTPGKGLRRIRCVGCAQGTLPRPLDHAPLCHRCSELLATADPAVDSRMHGWSTPGLFRAPRWLRRWSALD